MADIPKDVVTLIYHLLPGFLAAWIFYGLTAHPKATPFERVVEALIFTVIVQAITIGVRELLFVIGSLFSVGAWTSESTLVCSLAVAGVVGLLSARMANNNTIHEWLREWKWFERLRTRKVLSWLPQWEWTCRTSYPSEWYSAFRREKRWVILHLAGDRRLYGWPQEWPDQPDRGHFIIDQPEWILDDGKRAPLHQVEDLLVRVNQVEMVEFLKYNDEVEAEDSEIASTRKLLIGIRRQGEQNGSKGPTTSA